MTQAMPTALFVPNVGATAATKSARMDADDGFSDTFREQVDSSSSAADKHRDSSTTDKSARASEDKSLESPQSDDALKVSESTSADGAEQEAVAGALLQAQAMQEPITTTNLAANMSDGVPASAQSADELLLTGLEPVIANPSAANGPATGHVALISGHASAALQLRNAGQSASAVDNAIPNAARVGAMHAAQAGTVNSDNMLTGAIVSAGTAQAEESLTQNLSRVLDTPASTAANTSFTLGPGIAATSNAAISAAAVDAQATPLPDVDTPLSDSQWGRTIGARVLFGASQGIQSATIAINPRDLGPVNVNLQVKDGETSVNFVSHHAVVRDAIEAALPRLREMFEGEGITLGDVDISNGNERSNDDESVFADNEHPNSDAQRAAPAADALHQDQVKVADSLIDTFA